MLVARNLAISALFLLVSPFSVQASDFTVNLSDQFQRKVQVQKGGSCHVFSSVALFEAACFRRIGRHLDLSEASFFLQHLKAVWEDPSPSIRVETTQERRGNTLYVTNTTILNPHATKPLRPQEQDRITGIDGGDPKKTLKRLIDCSVCLREQELPFDARFLQDLNEIVQTFGDKEAEMWNRALDDLEDGKLSRSKAAELQATARKKARSGAVKALNERFAQYLDRNQRLNDDVADCLQQRPSMTDLGRIGTAEIKRKLDARLPVLCSLKMTYVKKDGSQTTGDHALLLIGYRKKKDGVTEYLLRDSNRAEAYWNSTITGCSEAQVLN